MYGQPPVPSDPFGQITRAGTRRQVTKRVVLDSPTTGDDVIHDITRRRDPDGAWITEETSRVLYLGCGHALHDSHQAFAVCQLCGATTCQGCAFVCTCGRVVCLRHSALWPEDGTRLCAECLGVARRNRRMRTIRRIALAPFVALVPPSLELEYGSVV